MVMVTSSICHHGLNFLSFNFNSLHLEMPQIGIVLLDNIFPLQEFTEGSMFCPKMKNGDGINWESQDHLNELEQNGISFSMSSLWENTPLRIRNYANKNIGTHLLVVGLKI
jgi:hypothetical protein